MKRESGLQTQDFSVVKRVDAVSPGLFTAAAQGDKLTKVVVVLSKGSKPFVTYEFQTVFVSSVRPGGGGGSDFPLEEVSFNFASSTYTYEK
jgi:type VI protein secretion system component Hcp